MSAPSQMTMGWTINCGLEYYALKAKIPTSASGCKDRILYSYLRFFFQKITSRFVNIFKF
jgi:hypothetical protein